MNHKTSLDYPPDLPPEIQEMTPESVLGIFENIFPDHPFSEYVNQDNVKVVMTEYATMSQLFPYLQAKAIGEVAIDSISQGHGITDTIELTTAVATFLVADETGIYNNACRNGNAGLIKILDTKKRFHYQFLVLDMIRLFGKMPSVVYSTETMTYLQDLYEGLSSQDDITRCATMIAFEAHAQKMITALWESLQKIFPSIDKQNLIYFQSHVGGDDPAEAYHVAMTQNLIQRIVPNEKLSEFLEKFKIAFRRNLDWCHTITNSL